MPIIINIETKINIFEKFGQMQKVLIKKLAFNNQYKI
jgi:hypothetical protein